VRQEVGAVNSVVGGAEGLDAGEQLRQAAGHAGCLRSLLGAVPADDLQSLHERLGEPRGRLHHD
jgi:hypothetical protein